MRRAELISGLLAGVLGLICAIGGTLLPVAGGGGGTVTERLPDGKVKVLASVYHANNLIQAAGPQAALMFMTVFTLLSLWAIVVTVQHVRQPRTDRLRDLRIVTALLFAAIVVGAPMIGFASGLATALLIGLLAFFFVPSALLLLICAILASVRQVRSATV
jgi:hypothetical protein